VTPRPRNSEGASNRSGVGITLFGELGKGRRKLVAQALIARYAVEADVFARLPSVHVDAQKRAYGIINGFGRSYQMLSDIPAANRAVYVSGFHVSTLHLRVNDYFNRACRRVQFPWEQGNGAL
jgi:hypothetical protein